MSQDKPIAELVATAALEMSEDIDRDYGSCKQYVLIFLGVDDEAALYNLRLRKVGEANSTSIRHVVENTKKVRALDIVQALATISAVAVEAPDKQKVFLAAVTAGLYFIKAFRKASTLKLEPADAAILWSLNRLRGDASIPELLEDWRHVVAASDEVEADTSEVKLIARLAQLEELGCVSVEDGRVSFSESIAEESINPMMP